ncbi:uncharacterized protein EV420DRAFT_1480227 [Desarmillaria tabescens]|uniref:Uncharacterized protein n=1 Tax=Armillaria tabescens TaxID=1929756 RepID=A0AA39KBS5_ARMTA|nr:uncharacterized protein EV420DRAFT_1480227 [Desarmillaria tabescens]KAK0458067.1 hypothetical protein EV420DRAFT_1480227 [Desarmillaria tabescens]
MVWKRRLHTGARQVIYALKKVVKQIHGRERRSVGNSTSVDVEGQSATNGSGYRERRLVGNSASADVEGRSATNGGGNHFEVIEGDLGSNLEVNEASVNADVGSGMDDSDNHLEVRLMDEWDSRTSRQVEVGDDANGAGLALNGTVSLMLSEYGADDLMGVGRLTNHSFRSSGVGVTDMVMSAAGGAQHITASVSIQSPSANARNMLGEKLVMKGSRGTRTYSSAKVLEWGEWANIQYIHGEDYHRQQDIYCNRSEKSGEEQQ